MSAVLKPFEVQLEPLTTWNLEQVMEIEQRAYPHPWTRGNFLDALRAGYHARVLRAGAQMIGYYVAMKGVDEVHLLNITVASEHQRQGWGRTLLDAMALWARAEGAQWLWLEVRVSNERAMAIYEMHGYRRMGLRKAYYPAGDGRREDAVVMSLRL